LKMTEFAKKLVFNCSGTIPLVCILLYRDSLTVYFLSSDNFLSCPSGYIVSILFYLVSKFFSFPDESNKGNREYIAIITKTYNIFPSLSAKRGTQSAL
jgi:hypothetical protein